MRLIEQARAGTTPFIPRFDGECDVAALVYGRNDSPDAVLSRFVIDLRNRGINAIGLLQRRRVSGLQPIEHYLIPDALGDTDRPADADFDDLAEALLRASTQNPDLIVLNRFGWREANGSGLLKVLGAAIDNDIPVVIAVPDALFDRWLNVSQGLTTKVSCDLPDLRLWWRDLRSSRAGDESFCGRYR